MAIKKFRNLLLSTALAGTLTACGGGGGGGGVPISFSPPSVPSLNLSTNIFGTSSSVISLVKRLSADQIVDASEAVEAFKFVQKYNGTFDTTVLKNYNIVIDGKSMDLEKGWFALVGYTKKYYEGKESFWNNLIKDKTYDDTNEHFVAIEKQLQDDVKKTNLVDTLYATGKAEIDRTETKPRVLLSTTTGAPYKTGATQVIPGTEWTLTTSTPLTPVTISTDTVRQVIGGEVFDVTTTVTRTDSNNTYSRIDTVNEAQARKVYNKYEVTTETYFTNGDKKVTVSYQTDEITESLASVSSTTTTTKTETVTGTNVSTVTRNPVANTVVSTVSIAPIVVAVPVESSPYVTTTYTDGSSIETITISDPVLTYTYTTNVVDTDNGDGTKTRKTYSITHTTSTKSRSKSIDFIRTFTDVTKKDITTTTTTTPVTRVTYLNGDVQDIQGTPSTAVETNTVIVSESTRTETINVSTASMDPITETTDNNPGVLVSTETISTAYTDADPNLGTRTPGYSTDKTTYETDEYKGVITGGSIQNYSRDQIKASEAYARGWTGKGVKIAVADTGYDTDHSEFAGQVFATKDYTGTGMEDAHGHGTHVLGTMVAKKDGTGIHGVAFDATAAVIKIGNSSYVDTSAAATGFSWAADQGAVAGNLSANTNYDSYFRNSLTALSDGTYKSTDSRYNYGAGVFYNMQDPTEWKAATDKGIVIVNSAGNQGLAVSANPGYFATAVDSNGDLLLGGKMLIVGAVDRNNNITSWSNKAGHICQSVDAGSGTCNDRYKVSDFYILAPGYTWSAKNDGTYSGMSGTSMAAPIVTGSVAVISQMWPYMKGENLVKLLTTTACKSSCITGYNVNIHGSGLLDLEKATRPVGAVGIPTTGRTTSSVSTVSLSGTGGSGSSLSALSNSTALSSVMIVDSFARDFYVDLTKGITVQDKRKFSDVRVAQYGASYLPFQQQYGNYEQGGQFPMFMEGLELGLYSDKDGNGDWSTNISKKFKLSDKFSIKTTAGTMSEQNTWLGNVTDGALAVGKNNTTNFGQLGLEYTLGTMSFTFDVAQGYTDVNTLSNSIISGVDTLETQSMKLGFEKKIDAETKWGITYSIPNRITKGSANLNIPYATTLSGDVVYDNVKTDMSAKTPERDIGVYYSHQGEGETDWKTSFSLEYRQNVAGVAGDNKFVPAFNVSKKFWGACMSFFGKRNERPGCQKIRAKEKLAKLSKQKGKEKEIADLKLKMIDIDMQIAKINGVSDKAIAKMEVDRKMALGWNR
jgi:subtilisin family serine protease